MKNKRGAPLKAAGQLGKNVLVRLPPPVLTKLDRRATQQGLSRSACIRTLIIEGLTMEKERKLLASWVGNSIDNASDSLRSGTPADEVKDSLFDSLVALREFSSISTDTSIEHLEKDVRRALRQDPIDMQDKEIDKELQKRLRKKGTLEFVLEQARDSFGEDD